MSQNADVAAADAPPWEPHVTSYDLAHLVVYLRLLDAVNEGAAVEEIAPTLLGIDAHKEPTRAQRVLEAHHRRAVWMTQVGYRDLLAMEGRKLSDPLN